MAFWPFQKSNGHEKVNGFVPPPPLPYSDPVPEPPKVTPPPVAKVAPVPTELTPTVISKDVKLPLPIKRVVCDLLGQYRTPSEIQRHLKETYNLVVSEQAIGYYGHPKSKWMPLIQRSRATFLAQLQEIPISQKAVRLDRYERLYQRAVKANKDHDARLALFGAQKEMDGVGGDTTVYVHQQILQMGTQELEQRRRDIAEKLSQLGGADAILEARTVVRGGGAERAEEETG